MNGENPYLRIGTTYYKQVQKPTINGETNETLERWAYEIIVRDLKMEQMDVTSYIKAIPRYDGMDYFPSHTNYQRVHGTFYNAYFPLPHIPTKGDITHTLRYLKHVFDFQLELGLDYLQLLYINPSQILPILCLVSKENQTGKTTFLKWLKMIYLSNMSFLDSNNISNRFNSDWMGKILVGVEEASIQDDRLIEILKNISTADKYNSESKGKDRVEVDLFLKVVLCSNKENDLLRIDNEDIRFWVIKVPTIPEDAKDVHLLDKLKEEIPAFLDYLLSRTLSVPKAMSRMWFTPQQLETKALRRMRLASRGKFELELAIILCTAMDDLDVEELCITPNDALYIMGKPKSFLIEVRRILKTNWRLVAQDNSNSYKRLLINDFGYHLNEGAKGRYYTITKQFLITNFDDLMN